MTTIGLGRLMAFATEATEDTEGCQAFRVKR